jgi:hypothetical protein
MLTKSEMNFKIALRAISMQQKKLSIPSQNLPNIVHCHIEETREKEPD